MLMLLREEDWWQWHIPRYTSVRGLYALHWPGSSHAPASPIDLSKPLVTCSGGWGHNHPHLTQDYAYSVLQSVGRTLLARICKRARTQGSATRTKWGKNFNSKCTYKRAWIAGLRVSSSEQIQVFYYTQNRVATCDVAPTCHKKMMKERV